MSESWQEFVMFVETSLCPGIKVPYCGLCGNSGVVKTDSKALDGTPVGYEGPCICPNGRGEAKRRRP